MLEVIIGYCAMAAGGLFVVLVLVIVSGGRYDGE